MKGVSKYQALNFFRHLIALDTQSRQLLRQARRNDAGSLSAQNHNGLLGSAWMISAAQVLPIRGASLTSRLTSCF